jgi:hypothetical protein
MIELILSYQAPSNSDSPLKMVCVTVYFLPEIHGRA